MKQHHLEALQSAGDFKVSALPGHLIPGGGTPTPGVEIHTSRGVGWLNAPRRHIEKWSKGNLFRRQLVKLVACVCVYVCVEVLKGRGCRGCGGVSVHECTLLHTRTWKGVGIPGDQYWRWPGHRAPGADRGSETLPSWQGDEICEWNKSLRTNPARNFHKTFKIFFLKLLFLFIKIKCLKRHAHFLGCV